MKKFCLVFIAMAAALAIAPAAIADTWNFTISGSGITSSGTITATAAGGGVFDITSIAGTFTDSGAGIINGTITALVPGSYDSANPSSVPAGSIGSQEYNFMFDDLLYPTGAAPAVCGTSGGEMLDGCGVVFDVGGDVVNVWGGGYQVAAGTGSYSDQFLDEGTNVSFTLTPEPGSLLLLGTGLLGLAFVAFRKAKASGLTLSL